MNPSCASATVADVAEQIVMAREHERLGRTIFFVGAGCSVSAGVPAVPALADRMIRSIATKFRMCGAQDSGQTCYNALLRAGKIGDHYEPGDREDAGAAPDWYKIYDECFTRYYRTPDDVRDLFGAVIGECNGAINWAHLCLGEMVAQKLVSTVLTTNFDQLALAGLTYAGVLPVVCDGIESLNRISPSPLHPQLVELHGSRHTYRLRNSPAEVAAVRNDHAAIGAIRALLQHATTFVAVGYGGRENGVMDLLIQAAQTYPDKNLYWVTRHACLEETTSKVQQFLGHSRNSALVTTPDADLFFLELCQHTGVGLPRAIQQPLLACKRVLESLERSILADTIITSELKQAQNMLGVLEACEAQARDQDTLANLLAQVRDHRLAGRAKDAYDLIQRHRHALQDGPLAPMLLLERMRAAEQLGEAALGRDRDPVLARAHFEQAKNDSQRVLEHDPDNPDVLQDLSTTLDRLGDILLLQGDVAGARASFEESLRVDIRRSSLADDHSTQRYLAISHRKLSEILALEGNAPAAIEEGKASLALYRAIYEEGMMPSAGIELVSAHGRLGDLFTELDMLPEGEAANRQALELATEMDKERLSDEERQACLSRVHHRLGLLARKAGDMELAQNHYEQSLEADRRRVELDPTCDEFRIELAVGRASLARMLKLVNKHQLARELLESSIKELDALLAVPGSPFDQKLNLAIMKTDLADLLDDEPRSGEKVVALLTDAVSDIRSLMDAGDMSRPVQQDHIVTLAKLAFQLEQAGREEEGRAAARSVLAAIETFAGAYLRTKEVDAAALVASRQLGSGEEAGAA